MHFDIIRFGFLSFDSKCFGLVRFVVHKVGSIFMCRHVRKLFYCAVHLLSKMFTGNWVYLPPANEVCEGYVFTGVCLSTLGGRRVWFYSGEGGMRGFIRGVHGFIPKGMRGFIRGACMVLFGGHAWFYLGGVCGFIRGVRGFIWGGMRGFIWGACVVLFRGHAWFYSGGHAWFFQFFRIQSDTVNERAVRILLECILVF